MPSHHVNVSVYSIEQRKQQQHRQLQLQNQYMCITSITHTHASYLLWIRVQKWMQFVVTLRINININEQPFMCLYTIDKIHALEKYVDENANEKYQVEWAATHTHTHTMRIYCLNECHLKSAEKHPMCAIKTESRIVVGSGIAQQNNIHTPFPNEEIDANCACLGNYIIDFNISCTLKSQNGH